MDSFSHAAKAGLEVGRGQTGGALRLPHGVPGPIVERLHALAGTVFTRGFVDAMRPTLVLPICIILLAACSCLMLRRGGHAAQWQPAAESETSTSVA